MLKSDFQKIFLFFCFAISLMAYSQNTENFIPSDSDILASAITEDGKNIAFCTNNKISILEVHSFSILQSMEITLPEHFAIRKIEFLNNSPDVVLVYTGMLSSYGILSPKNPILEYPEEEIYFCNVKEKKLISKLSGSTYISSFHHDKTKALVAANNYAEGETYKFARSGELGILSSESEKANGIIRSLKVSPKDDLGIVMYFDSLATGKSEYFYSLELRSLPDLKVLKKNSFVSPVVLDKIQFSSDQKAIAVFPDQQVRMDKNPIFFDTELNPIDQLNSETQFAGFKTDEFLWEITNNEILQKEVSTGKIKNQIWANLTYFGQLENIFALNNNNLIIVGKSLIGHKKNGIQLFSLKDNKEYTEKAEIAEEEQLYDPSKMVVMDNIFLGENIQVNEEKKLLLTYEKKHLQLWELENFRKLYDLDFEEEVDAFLSNNGKEILIIEKFSKDKGFSDILLKVLDIQTGKTRIKPYVGEDDILSVSSPKCFNINLRPEEWLCSDGDSSLKKINSKTLEISILKNFNADKKYKPLLQVDIQDFDKENNLALLTINNNVNYKDYPIGIFTYQPETEKLEELPKNLYDTAVQYDKDLYFINKNQLLYTSDKGLEVFDIFAKSSKVVLPNSGKKKFEISKGKTETFVSEASSDGKNLYTISNSSGTIIKEQKNFPGFAGKGFVFDGSFNYFNKGFVRLIDHYSYTNPNVEQQSNQGIFSIQLSDSGNLLFKNKMMIDLASLEIKDYTKEAVSLHLLNNEKDEVIFAENSGGMASGKFVFCIATVKNPKEILWKSQEFDIPDNSVYHFKFDISDDGRKILVTEEKSGTSKGSKTYFFVDTEQKKAAQYKAESNIAAARLFSESKMYMLGNSLYDWDSHKIIKKVETFPDPSFSEKMFVTATNSGVLNRYKKEADGTYSKKNFITRNNLDVYSGRNNLMYIPEFRYYTGSTYNSIVFWKEDSQSPIKTLYISPNKIIDVKKLKEKLYILTENDNVFVVDLKNLEVTLRIDILQYKENEYQIAAFTPEGYFMAPKNVIRKFHFVKDNKTFPVHSYELFLNRPDLVLDKLGFIDGAKKELYRQAFENRLKRAGITNEKDFLAILRPSVELQNKSKIPKVTENEEVTLEMKLSDNTNSVIIYDNGVPVYENKQPASGTVSAKIKLISGENNISIITRNKEQIEGNPVSVIVNNLKKTENRKVYYIGIGVSNYVNSSMNLKYADKDVNSLNDYLQLKYRDQYEFHSLLNEEATRENILKIKEILNKTSVEDIVILSLSGHGVINDDYDFFFATYDLDFKNPQLRGLKYSEIQDLLSGIPARRKLLLLDACHSGEIYKTNELVAQDHQTVQLQKNVTGYTPKGSEGNSIAPGEDESFALMQNLFFDTERGNGAFIIAAAGGREFAYEGEEWKNGVFTYSLINSIRELGYDTWKGSLPIPVSKLKSAVNQKVTALTDGMQKPTSRSENIEWDWEL